MIYNPDKVSDIVETSDWYFVFYFSLFFIIAARLAFIHIPLFIGDEAQIMTFGAQIMNGGIYGLDVVDTRGPGGYYIGAILTYFIGYGNTIGYHVAGIAFQVINIILIHRLGVILTDERKANTACLFYAIFSYAYILHDTVAFNVEIMALPFLLGSAIVFCTGLLKSWEDNSGKLQCGNWIFCGLLCAIVFTIKQVIAGCLAVYGIILALNYIANNESISKIIIDISYLLGGFLIGITLLLGYPIYLIGFGQIIYWMAIFASKYYNPGALTRITLFVQRLLLLFIAQPLLWILSLGWITYFIYNFKDVPKTNRLNIFKLFLLLMLGVQWLGVFVAGHPVGHYFIPSIAFMSIMAGDLSVTLITSFKRQEIEYRFCLLIIFIIIGFLPPVINYSLFPEGVQTAEYSIKAFFQEKLWENDDPIRKATNIITKTTAPADKIFVIGRLYEIYPLSKRLPVTIATGLNWFENRQEDQYLKTAYRDIISALQNKSPKLIILPCEIYGGFDIHKGPWQEVREILKEKYHFPVRLTWDSRLKFLRGKPKLMENINEWIDIYKLK